jgi:hypothetical protein
MVMAENLPKCSQLPVNGKVPLKLRLLPAMRASNSVVGVGRARMTGGRGD